jgi:hypothetical protein
MYVQRKRAEVFLRVEMLEDRRLLNGGLIRSLLASAPRLPAAFLSGQVCLPPGSIPG